MDKTGPRHDHKWNCFGYLGIALWLQINTSVPLEFLNETGTPVLDKTTLKIVIEKREHLPLHAALLLLPHSLVYLHLIVFHHYELTVFELLLHVRSAAIHPNFINILETNITLGIS